MNIFFRTTISFFVLVSLPGMPEIFGQKNLRKEIAGIVQTADASIGVAIMHLESGDTISFQGSVHFPMQSVYKFHLALAVLAAVENGKLSLDQKVLIRQEDFFPNTVSQIAEKYPKGNVELTIEELLFYTVATSDNNGCDILFRMLGGPDKVQDYIHALGITDVAIVNTEAEMHRDWNAQFNNWTTPKATVNLLNLFYQNKILSSRSTALLVKIMEQTSTGKHRIKGHLPAGTVVAHKTGMGGKNDIISAINDVGIVTLPSGEHVAVAFFIANPRNSVAEMEGVMARVSKLVFDHYLSVR
ncbi:MAG TPA: class A beta-lactamase, subclass A2 [Chryseolinea sp.]